MTDLFARFWQELETLARANSMLGDGFIMVTPQMAEAAWHAAHKPQTAFAEVGDERRLAAHEAERLTHTQMMRVFCDGAEMRVDPNWNALHRAFCAKALAADIRLARLQAITGQGGGKKITSADKLGIAGWRQYPELGDLWVHGVSAPEAWRAVTRIAATLDSHVEVKFFWSGKYSEFPEEEGVISFTKTPIDTSRFSPSFAALRVA